jgi:hypothetical protein
LVRVESFSAITQNTLTLPNQQLSYKRMQDRLVQLWWIPAFDPP